MDTGTSITLALAALAVASTSGAVLWRVRSAEQAIDRLSAEVAALRQSVATEHRLEVHSKQDDDRYQEMRTKFHDVGAMLNTINLELAVVKERVEERG